MNRLLTMTEVSELTRLSTATLYAYVATNKIPHLKLGSRTMFDPAELEKWLRKRTVAPVSNG